MARNTELKAHLSDVAAATHVAQALGAVLHAVERQHDTYFHVPHGRLKLRQRWIADVPQPSELIWYLRPDAAAARGSDYSLVRVAAGDGLRAALAGALGVAVEVVKRRTVYLHDNVRIHLDDVVGLGTFLEFEAIVDATCDDAAAYAKVERLRALFGVRAEALVTQSYADLRVQHG